jgi:DNA-binding winged helix-turn-helix (wHTH) protein
MSNTRSAGPGTPTIQQIARDAPLADRFRIGDWVVEPSINRMRRGRQEARLEPKVVDLLVYLANHSNQVVSRGELEASVWEGAVVGYDTLTGAIQKLRRALGDDRAHPRYIETLSKRGYRLIAPVRARSAPSRGRLARIGDSAGPLKPAKQSEPAIATRIYLVRHGTTELMAEDRFGNSMDAPLSEEGRRQAMTLGERLRGDRLIAVYASPASRTLETAQIIARPHGQEPLTEPALGEIEYGHW